MRGLQPGWVRQSMRNLAVLGGLGAVIILPLWYLLHLQPRNVVSDTPSGPAVATDAAGPVGWTRCLLNIAVDPTDAQPGWRSDLDVAIGRFRRFGIKFQYEILRASDPDESVALSATHMDILITWRSASDSKVLTVGAQEFPDASLTVPSAGARQDVLLAMTNTEIGGVVGAPPSLTGAEITVNASVESLFGVPRGPKLADLLTHELGHAIGLGHTSDPNDVMFKYLDVRPGPATFTVSARTAEKMYAFCKA